MYCHFVVKQRRFLLFMLSFHIISYIGVFSPGQLSFVAQVPALGLGLYQLSTAVSGGAETAEYVFLRQGGELSVNMKHFTVNIPQDASTPLSIHNPHLQIWSSPTTGLMEVSHAQHSIAKLCTA